MRSLPYENAFRLQVHSHAHQTYFHMKRFARGLVLKQKHKVTQKYLIPYSVYFGLLSVVIGLNRVHHEKMGKNNVLCIIINVPFAIT